MTVCQSRSALTFIMTLALMLAGTGCVSQGEYDDLQTLYRTSQDQLAGLRAELAEANARVAALSNRPPEVDDSALKAATEERDRLQTALAEMEARLRELGSANMVLPPELDSALIELAESNPELMEYLPNLGLVRFRSDLTFALGSTDVKDPAVQGLQKLATILKGPQGADYEARIVGHTDNVPIRREPTREKHPTNWHLSVHRAIAVKDVLEGAGVPSARLGVAGYAQYRPIVPNKGGSGAEANRRVEIYLLPYNPPKVSPPAKAATPPSAPAATPEAAPIPEAVPTQEGNAPPEYNK